MVLVSETFKALGDPARLEMIERLSNGTLYTVGTLSGGLGLTRQGARKHIQSLANADLVTLHRNGRQTEVTLNAESLGSAKLFIAELELRWDLRLQALRDLVENDSAASSRSK
jgi:DNA-binding transcriptional ArsR family regulator